MKQIHTAPTKQATEIALREFENKWAHKYVYTVLSWNKKGSQLQKRDDFSG